ncbi:hypothetical protein AMS68_004653 [Peltaster fructicola]|uniref:Small ribosomal subunit protein uS5m n=1 Tax=Peltaster fructicola TaxID=286661 RepID=A0A6H0XWS7_9PEZI|nr:hypothetical protein AMS68_004653 [Peltaster fructicola]
MASKTKPYRCLSCRLTQLTISNTRRQFHISTSKSARQPAYPNVKASDLGLINATTSRQSSPVQTKPYTDQEKALLRKKYTEEQMAIIDIGEEAIPAEDMIKQGLQRTDPTRIAYYDDFSTKRPVIDYPSEATEAEDGADQLKAQNITYEQDNGVQKDEDRVQPALRRVMQQTGYTEDEIKKLRVKHLVTHRVVNQTRMGKIQSMYYLSIAGNGDGMLGIGEGKAVEDMDAARQSEYAAIRNMKPIMRYEDRTIFGEVESKVAATVVQIQSRPPGFGNRCQHLIFEMARAAGIHDLAARTPRSRNKMNVVKAAYQALLSQRHPEDIAKSRGRKMIDVRKVYYGGSVP